MTLEQEFSRISNYFSASHFLIGFDKCDRLHGHNYKVKIRLKYAKGTIDEIKDFRLINSILKEVLDKLNQRILLPENSEEMQISSEKNKQNLRVTLKDKYYSFPQEDVVILEDILQTTTENLAIYLHKALCREICEKSSNQNIHELIVVISETEGNKAIYGSEIGRC